MRVCGSGPIQGLKDACRCVWVGGFEKGTKEGGRKGGGGREGRGVGKREREKGARRMHVSGSGPTQGLKDACRCVV